MKKIFTTVILLLLASFTGHLWAQVTSNFSISSTSGCIDDAFSLTDLSTGPIINWNWDFGDGSSSSAQNPSHVYSDTGTFTITLVVDDGAGATDSHSLTYTVNTPKAAFVLNPENGCGIPHTVFFTDQSTLPDTWFWDFGDGNTSTLQNPVHNYITPGSFNVTLTVIDTITGCSDNETRSVHVSIPSADFSGSNLFGCGPLTTVFTDNSTVSGGNIASWHWEFGDGNTSSLQNPSHTYDAPGVYSVQLTITAANGCQSTESKTNYVQVIGPDIDFEGDVLQACHSLSVNFTDNTTFGAPITSWSWNFGDGNVSSLQNPTHLYNAPGEFDVSLTITDIDGCNRTLTQAAYINVLPPATSTDVHIACDSLVWIDGNTYTSNNNTATYQMIGAAANGCDSLITLDLTIIHATSGIDTRTACDSLVWIDGNTYTSSNNTATHTLMNAAGCDSVVTLDLTINSVSDVSTTISGPTIEANNLNATYIWLDCNDNFTAIPGETGQTYTATNNGNYAVQITENGCVDTSDCIAIVTCGIIENQFGSQLNVYPNPTMGELNIDLGNTFSNVFISITDVQGKVVQSKSVSSGQLIPLSFEAPKGLYFLTIETPEKRAILKLMKH